MNTPPTNDPLSDYWQVPEAATIERARGRTPTQHGRFIALVIPVSQTAAAGLAKWATVRRLVTRPLARQGTPKAALLPHR